MTEQLFCPICFHALDRFNSCWIPCEYEADIALPQYAALNKKQALEGRLASAQDRLKMTNKQAKSLKLNIKTLNDELEQCE